MDQLLGTNSIIVASTRAANTYNIKAVTRFWSQAECSESGRCFRSALINGKSSPGIHESPCTHVSTLLLTGARKRRCELLERLRQPHVLSNAGPVILSQPQSLTVWASRTCSSPSMLLGLALGVSMAPGAVGSGIYTTSPTPATFGCDQLYLEHHQCRRRQWPGYVVVITNQFGSVQSKVPADRPARADYHFAPQSLTLYEQQTGSLA